MSDRPLLAKTSAPAPDPLQLRETGMMVVVPPAPRPLTHGERAVLFFALMVATVAVGMWSSTLREPAGFCIGLGWMVVLLEVSGWERDVDRTDG